MSKFFSGKLSSLKPYVPGEQPQEREYIKLNTNESPFFPSVYAIESIQKKEIEDLRLYSDPECSALKSAVAKLYGVKKENVLPSNGSDEILAFAFAAFGDKGACFPDVTYGFYKVFAGLFGVNYTEIPLKSDFSINICDYFDAGKTIVIANPNAQTGIYLPPEDIEKIIISNRNSVVIIDEAYIDFGGTSAVKFIDKYDNLLVVQTLSKSRSLAGARVGFAIANENLIADLSSVKYSFNPYNVNRLSARLAEKAINDADYFEKCTKTIIENRSFLIFELEKLGFSVLPSLANFVLAEHERAEGKFIYEKLKESGVLVRRFDDERIKNHVRITVGTKKQIEVLIEKLKEIL